jgi:hypothetical protein
MLCTAAFTSQEVLSDRFSLPPAQLFGFEVHGHLEPGVHPAFGEIVDSINAIRSKHGMPALPIRIDISKGPARVIVRTDVLPETKEMFTEFCGRLGMTQIAVTTRLVEWLCTQPDVIQAAVLELYPSGIRDKLPSMIIKHMAQANKATPSDPVIDPICFPR